MPALLDHLPGLLNQVFMYVAGRASSSMWLGNNCEGLDSLEYVVNG